MDGLPAGTDWEDSGCSTGNSALYLQGTQAKPTFRGPRHKNLLKKEIRRFIQIKWKKFVRMNVQFLKGANIQFLQMNFCELVSGYALCI